MNHFVFLHDKKSNGKNNEKENNIQKENDQMLLVSKVSQSELKEISNMICRELRLSSTAGDNAITKLPSIREIRHMDCDGKDYYYSIIMDDQGGKLFIFLDYIKFRNTEEEYYRFSDVLFTNKQLKFSDFNLLQEGVSTKNDVKEIDSNEGMSESWKGMDTVDEDVTIHMAQEGVVIIVYKKEKVKEVKYYDSALMKKMKKCGDY